LVLCKFFLFHRPISFSARDLSICNESRLLLDYTTNLIDLAPTSPAYAQAASPLFTIDKSPADRSLDMCRIAEAEGAQTNYMREFLELPQTKFVSPFNQKTSRCFILCTSVSVCVCVVGCSDSVPMASTNSPPVQFQTMEREKRRRRQKTVNWSQSLNA
jgi:hypothetical protein